MIPVRLEQVLAGAGPPDQRQENVHQEGQYQGRGLPHRHAAGHHESGRAQQGAHTEGACIAGKQLARHVPDEEAEDGRSGERCKMTHDRFVIGIGVGNIEQFQQDGEGDEHDGGAAHGEAIGAVHEVRRVHQHEQPEPDTEH